MAYGIATVTSGRYHRETSEGVYPSRPDAEARVRELRQTSPARRWAVWPIVSAETGVFRCADGYASGEHEPDGGMHGHTEGCAPV